MNLNRTEALAYIARQVGYRNLRRYQARAGFLFRKVPLDGRCVLDVGCGRGTFALWAAMHNAEYVLGIEPEAEGSTSGTLQTFGSIISELGLESRIEAQNLFLQDLPIPEKPFDIVVMFNVINHLDEDAVQHLHEDPKAVESYLEILHHLRQLMTADGVLIIADCARNNFWSALGLKSPLARAIEWHKHQNPATWINVLSKAGFHLQDLRWSHLYPFGWLTTNRLVQYMTASHFVLRVRAGKSA